MAMTIEAIIKVFSKATGGHSRPPSAVGRCDDAQSAFCVLRRRLVPFLQNAQELDLYAGRELADFVENNVPPRPSRSGRPFFPVAPVNAPRSCPNSSLSRMVSGIAAAIDGHERGSRGPERS